MTHPPKESKSSCSRWVRLCVDIFDHDILDKGPFDRRSAWTWMIANAAWHDRRINHKGRPMKLARGQLLAGRSFLAEKWGWGEKQVRNFLELLSTENMIETGQSDGHYANVITICNYDAYQTPENRDGQTDGQCGASAGPEEGQTLTKNTNTTNNNNQQSVEQDAAREKTDCPDLKLAFNGSTEAMIEDIQRFMGPQGDRKSAQKWLTGTLAAFGQQRTAQAWTIVTTKAVQGEAVANPLAFWSRTAGGLKATASASPKPVKLSRW